MPLSSSNLANLIYNNLKSLPEDKFKDVSGTWEQIAQKIADAVVTEIVTNALVTTDVAPSQLGVVPGQTGGPVPLTPTRLIGKIS